jgi:hypothetical protein
MSEIGSRSGDKFLIGAVAHHKNRSVIAVTVSPQETHPWKFLLLSTNESFFTHEKPGVGVSGLVRRGSKALKLRNFP